MRGYKLKFQTRYANSKNRKHRWKKSAFKRYCGWSSWRIRLYLSLRKFHLY